MVAQATLTRRLLYLRLRITRILSREGVGYLARRIGRRLFHAVFQTNCSVWLSMSPHEVAPIPKAERDWRFKFLIEDKTELLDWLKVHNVQFPWMYLPKEVKIATTEEHIFVTVLYAGDIVGYIKVGVGPTYIHDFDKVIFFPPGHAFVYDTFVLPEWRRKHAAFEALIHTIQFLRNKGFEKVWCHIEEWNRASFKTFRKAGFVEKGRIRFCRIIGIVLFLQDGCKPLVRLQVFLR